MLWLRVKAKHMHAGTRNRLGKRAEAKRIAERHKTADFSGLSPASRVHPAKMGYFPYETKRALHWPQRWCSTSSAISVLLTPPSMPPFLVFGPGSVCSSFFSVFPVASFHCLAVGFPVSLVTPEETSVSIPGPGLVRGGSPFG